MLSCCIACIFLLVVVAGVFDYSCASIALLFISLVFFSALFPHNLITYVLVCMYVCIYVGMDFKYWTFHSMELRGMVGFV